MPKVSFVLFLILSFLIPKIYSQGPYSVNDNITNVTHLTKAGDYFYFSGKIEDNIHSQLWKINSPGQKPERIVDIKTGGAAFSPSDLGKHKDKLYFMASASNNDIFSKLWVTDGTKEGTKILKDFGQNNRYWYWIHKLNFTEFKDNLYFTFPLGESGYDFYMITSPDDSITLIKNLYPDAYNDLHNPVIPPPSHFTIIGDKLFFVAFSAEDERMVLWVSDGTAEGTQEVKSVSFPGYSGNEIYQSSFKMINYRDKLVFTKYDSRYGFQPWVSDGTEEGTYLLTRLENEYYEPAMGLQISNMFIHRGQLVIQGREEGIWIFNQIERTAPFVANRVFNSTYPTPVNTCSYGDEVFYISNDYAKGQNFVKLVDGPELIEHIHKLKEEYNFSSYLRIPMTVYNNRLYFGNSDRANKGFLAEYDKYKENLRWLRSPTLQVDYKSEFVEFKGTLYFNAHYMGSVRLFELTTKPAEDTEKELSCDCDLYAYPNPTSDYLTVQFYRGDPQPPVELKIFDAAGQFYSEALIDENSKEVYHTFDTSSLQAGIYFLQVKTGEHKINKKIQIQ